LSIWSNIRTKTTSKTIPTIAIRNPKALDVIANTIAPITIPPQMTMFHHAAIRLPGFLSTDRLMDGAQF